MKLTEIEVNAKEEVVTKWREWAEIVFTINIPCPHCKKDLSFSLSKLEMRREEE